MKIVVDRFEGNYVLVELPDHTLAVFPKQLLDPEVKVGDVVEIRLDREATEARSKGTLEFLDGISARH